MKGVFVPRPFEVPIVEVHVGDVDVRGDRKRGGSKRVARLVRGERDGGVELVRLLPVLFDVVVNELYAGLDLGRQRGRLVDFVGACYVYDDVGFGVPGRRFLLSRIRSRDRFQTVALLRLAYLARLICVFEWLVLTRRRA